MSLIHDLASQIASWTTLESIEECVENIEANGTQNATIYLAYPSDDTFEEIFIEFLDMLSATYRFPHSKASLLSAIGKPLSPDTSDKIFQLRFTPEIRTGGEDAVRVHCPHITDPANLRVLAISDAAPVIDLLFDPLRMLLRLAIHFWDQAKPLQGLIQKSMAETGGAPTIVHRPYSDGTLPATLDALIYFKLGLHVGSFDQSPPSINSECGCTNLIGNPPFPPDLIHQARLLPTRQH